MLTRHRSPQRPQMAAAVAVFVPFILMVCVSQLPAAASSFKLTSPAFKPGGTIPHHFSYHGYGCNGENVSPELRWSGAPSATKRYAVTVFHHDAQKGVGWWHWVVFNIPAEPHRLAENAGASSGEKLPPHALQGQTNFQSAGYGGPCPPVGDPPHHYVFTLYALDVPELKNADAHTTGPQLESLMKGHVLAKAQLIGRFGR